MTAGWARLSVDYCQYGVSAVPGASALDIYTAGDGLLHVGGPSQFTGFCGIHTGPIEARIRVRPGPRAEHDWDAISEVTLWCPSGRLSMIGLMGGSAEALTDVAVPRGLIRVRVHARNRLHETVRTDADPPEQHELHIWAVSEEAPHRTVRADPGGRGWEPNPAKAAEWAMLSLVPRPSTRPSILPPLPRDPYEDDTGLPRVTVVRHRPAPIELPVGVLPVGDLEIRLDRVDHDTLTWTWAVAAEPIFPRPLTDLPDQQPTTVRATLGPDGVTLRHEGALGRHATALGLIWDHLLDAAGSRPWEAKLQAQAAEATAQVENARRQRAERWGGHPPSERLRGLPVKAQPLARLDRPLLDRLEALSAPRQREVARWAARRALAAAGLAETGWIADALAAAEAGRPPPRPVIEPGGATTYGWVLASSLESSSTMTEQQLQLAASRTVLALANDDPLAAAIDTVYKAALAHGHDRARFLTDAHNALN